jgi:hypothetical protein
LSGKLEAPPLCSLFYPERAEKVLYEAFYLHHVLRIIRPIFQMIQIAGTKKKQVPPASS